MVRGGRRSGETGVPEYRIGEVIRELDLGQYTLKHYERQGLIEPLTSDTGFRFYTRMDFGKIIVIRSLRRLGFSIEEVAELLEDDAAAVADALEEKHRANERAIAELQEANTLLHRHVSSLRNNLSRPERGVFDPEASGLVFVPHFLGDELAGGGCLVDPSAWRDLYEWSLIGLRVERGAVEAEGSKGCWWGLVPLGNRSEFERVSAAGDVSVAEVPVGPALVASAEVEVEGIFDAIRRRALELLRMHGRELGGDVFAVADSTRLVGEGPSTMTLTLRIPVAG